jgi:hypothetical protein
VAQEKLSQELLDLLKQVKPKFPGAIPSGFALEALQNDPDNFDRAMHTAKSNYEEYRRNHSSPGSRPSGFK